MATRRRAKRECASLRSDDNSVVATLPLTPTLSGCPTFAPAYVGNQDGRSPINGLSFSLSVTTNTRVPHPSRCWRRVGYHCSAPEASAPQILLIPPFAKNAKDGPPEHWWSRNINATSLRGSAMEGPAVSLPPRLTSRRKKARLPAGLFCLPVVLRTTSLTSSWQPS
jgi:hypothetical protein